MSALCYIYVISNLSFQSFMCPGYSQPQDLLFNSGVSFFYFVFLFCDSIAQRVFMEDVGECVVTWSWRVNFKEE